MAEFPTYEEMGKEVAEKALDEFLYDDKSIREWMQIIASEDAISRQAVLAQINCWISSGEYRYTNATDYLRKRINYLSPVTPQPKMGHWIGDGNYICSCCKRDPLDFLEPCGLDGGSYIDTPMKYCPNCGVKMQEVKE